MGGETSNESSKVRRMRPILALRAVFFVLLLPGTVAGYVPFRIINDTHHLGAIALSVSSVSASALTLAGIAVLARCVWDFFASGHGTLAPIDPPRYLVVQGLYRITRNPMYNGVLAILLGEAWLFSSFAAFRYALIVFVFFHLFVKFYEEPSLESRFGEPYRAYRKAVPRWGFAIRPFPKRSGTTA
jgi:protein-S-isoprenylcysteine O-methyltransferase Ste14